MPDIVFILPHWIYWGGLLAVPAAFMLATRRSPPRAVAEMSAAVAYFFWAVAGFMGIHRLYLKNWGAAVFIALFAAVIVCNHQERMARNAHSVAKNEVFNADYDLKRAEEEEDAEAAAALRDQLKTQTAAESEWENRRHFWRRAAGAIALLILVLLLADAALLPSLVRQTRAAPKTPRAPPPIPSEQVSPPRRGEGRFARAVGKLNAATGEFAAYWTVIAVFVFYYEVIARYIFNSPTIWAHESMFLMFGMQYMLAGGFCLREGAHVRVDAVYALLPPKAKAAADLATSVFFFIFAAALTASGWIFFSDSYAMGQVSFTEWEIPYWPVKFALPLGGALLLLQGAAHTLRDFNILIGKDDGS